MRLCRLFAGLFLLGILFLAFRAEAECLSYQEKVDLKGELEQAQFDVPLHPENRKNPGKSDMVQPYLFLKLAKPVCVDADPVQPEINGEHDNLDLFEIEASEKMYEKYSDLIGRQVHVKGTLFGAIGVHHHTPVVIDHIEITQE